MIQLPDIANGIWSTPQAFFDKIAAEFPMTTDVCASAANAKCEPRCKKKGCEKRGGHVSKYIPGIEDWVKKAYTSAAEGSATVVCLLPVRMPDWWFDYCPSGEIRFIRGRLNFGNRETSGLFNSALVIFHAHLDAGNTVHWVTREQPGTVTPSYGKRS